MLAPSALEFNQVSPEYHQFTVVMEISTPESVTPWVGMGVAKHQSLFPANIVW